MRMNEQLDSVQSAPAESILQLQTQPNAWMAVYSSYNTNLNLLITKTVQTLQQSKETRLKLTWKYEIK